MKTGKSGLTTAKAIADAYGLNVKSYRAALRRGQLDWHLPNERWIVSPGSAEQVQMIAVAERMQHCR